MEEKARLSQEAMQKALHRAVSAEVSCTRRGQGGGGERERKERERVVARRKSKWYVICGLVRYESTHVGVVVRVSVPAGRAADQQEGDGASPRRRSAEGVCTDTVSVSCHAVESVS